MNNSKNSQKKKQKSQDPKRSRDLRIPVEPLVPQCEVCEEKKADFYCTKCEFYYCKNCESQVHTPFFKKKHQEFISKPFITPKKTNFNLCEKHKKELCLYCKDDNGLICAACYETCRKNNHSILGLNEYSNKISEKIKRMFHKIQKDEKNNKEKIRISLENQKKIRQEIKEFANFIENKSDLLIQKIQNSKINYLNLLKNVEIISNTNFIKILKEKEEKQIKINQKKKKIKYLKKLDKDEKTFKLILESNEIIQKEIIEIEEREKKKRKKEKEKDKFDPKMNRRNVTQLKNENKTAINSSKFKLGRICGEKIYSSGKHKIKIKIGHFPNQKNKENSIFLGVIKTENTKNFIKRDEIEEIYYFGTEWDRYSNIKSAKSKKENGKWTKKKYPEEINFKKNDILTISLDMDQKKIYFEINEKNLGGWENIPEKVNFFAELKHQKGEEKNQITII
ncbi:tripartite motif-containing protein [Anaeramoeba flamelloides]|uniref:Tripartite motif-containing protein n=1 Tax=Anaeramoeba flamelloides TaxID=1746091 RepID=A0AAV7Z3L5_9EUKA|nr:tripartite motif-containing protein [Anaeramoeba flamelloides]